MVDDEALKDWFFREIYPLEPVLTRYLRRNWQDQAEVSDLRQEVYARVYAAARERLPQQAKQYLLMTARNHLINKAKRTQVVQIDYVADLETSVAVVDNDTPERQLSAREELRRVQAGLERLPPRCRQVVVLRKIEGLSTREAAERLHVGIDTIERQMVHGMRALVDFMLGGTGKIRRERPASQQQKGKGES